VPRAPITPLGYAEEIMCLSASGYTSNERRHHIAAHCSTTAQLRTGRTNIAIQYTEHREPITKANPTAPSTTASLHSRAMKLELRRPSLPSLPSTKRRKQLEEFQKELDRPIRIPRNANSAGIPRVISLCSISTSIDVSDRRIDVSDRRCQHS
jgi:hypothetical protein